MLKIESPQNTTFKKLLSLTGAKGLKKEKLFLLSGEKLITEFLQKPHLEIVFEITTARLKPLVRAPGIEHIQLSAGLFTQLDAVGTAFNILVLEQPLLPIIKDVSSHESRGIEVVIPVGDPGNIGALIRSCEAFAVPRVILTEEAAHPFLPKSVKASAGSVLRVSLMRGPSLREFPDTCIALDMAGEPIDKFIWPGDGLLVVGEEGTGFAARGKQQFTRRVRIPTQGVQSLNAVVAASIALAYRANL